MKKTLIALAVSNALLATAYANDDIAVSTTLSTNEAGETTYDAQLQTMEVVVSSPFSQQVGTQKLTADDIKNRPTGNGNLSELMKNNPNVRYANNANTSTNAGEIAPNEVSIHGAKFYENNYTIDGLSNNDNINPGSGATGNLYGVSATGNLAGYSPFSLPAGGTQSFWLDSSLIKNIEVFDSNVSAKYGQFTGGLINADIKDPSTARPSGRIWYRTTRDSWANFHIDESDQESFEAATNYYNQPQFKKQQYGVEVNQPISDKASVLFAYNRTESEIPYYHSSLGKWENQERKNETYLLKGLYKPTANDTLRATLIYSPHESSYPKQNVENGLFTNTGGGYRANIEWQKKTDWGKMISYLGYRRTGNEIQHAADYYATYRNTDFVDWDCTTTTCNWGGYGKFETQKDTYTAKQDFKFNTIGDTLTHDISTGWQFDRASASYDRDQDSYLDVYLATTLTNCTYCIAGEQYVRTRTLYPARHVKVSDNSAAFYAEDSMNYKNLNLVAGLRGDYNQFMGNVDIAPRLSFTYDVFGDAKTRVIGGFNRYYANSMLAYKLREGIGSNILMSRTSATADFTSTSRNTGGTYSVSSLNTPYNDELNFGISQEWANSLWTLKWVRRDGKDGFAQTKTGSGSNIVYTLNNDGTSKNQNYTLTVNSLAPINIKDIADVSWQFGASYNQSKSNNTYYDATTLEADGITKVVYRDELLDITDAPSLDYNSPWTTFLAVNTHFPKYNLNWSQRLSYTDGYRSITRSTDTCSPTIAVCGDSTETVYIYSDTDHSNAFTYDWRLAYTLPLSGHKSLELTADINNILDRKIVASSVSTASTTGGTSYQLGRNFWLGVSFNW